MRKIILIRHGAAERNTIDYVRKLTGRGIASIKKTVSDISDLLPSDISKVRIVASSAERTSESARIIAENINFPEESLELVKSLYISGTSTYLNIIEKTDDSIECLIIIGHNPAITMLTEELLDSEIAPMKTGSAAVLGFQTDRWQNIFVVAGELLRFVI